MGGPTEYLEQEREHDIWNIVELFYRSHITFKEQFERYEWRVLQHSYQKGLHRLDLRLNPDDLAGLLDFKALEQLRDEFIHELKDRCHVVFRGQERTDALDRYVSDIFHEISILKEEHYNVKTYAPQYALASAETELSYILDEAHAMFPKKLSHIRFLYRKAQDRMEEMLSSFTSNKIFIRSLYLNRDDFVKEAYEHGIDDFYKFMYPELGPLAGYYEAGMSFFRSGFYVTALEAFRCAEEELRKTQKTGEKANSKTDALKATIRNQVEKLCKTQGDQGSDGADLLDIEAGFTS